MSAFLSHLAAAASGILATVAVLGPRLRVLHRRLATANHRASHDPLTGLANRRSVMAHLRDATRRGEPVGVILIDLDNFKAVNDAPGIGHHGGDVLLRQIAQLLDALPAPVRLAARLGGDEFLLITDGDLDVAADIAHQMWELISGAPFGIAGHHLDVGASVGYASSRLGLSAAKLLRYADLAMYDAKHAGGGTAAYRPSPTEPELDHRPAHRNRDRQHTRAQDTPPPGT